MGELGKQPHPGTDALFELAVDQVSQSERRTMLEHLVRCGRCREEYAECARVVEQSLAAAPRVQPRAGFDARTLEALGMQPARRGTLSRFVHPRRSLRESPHWRSLLAGGVAAGLLIGLPGGYLLAQADGRVDRAEGGRGEAAAVAAAVPLVRNDGMLVGSVSEGRSSRHDLLVVDISDGPPGVRYRCRLVLADGHWRDGGAWTLRTTRATWVVPTPRTVLSRVKRVDLVTDDDVVWASAAVGI